MKTHLKYTLTGLLVLMLLVGFTTLALAFDSPGEPTELGPNTITWTGQGGGDDFEEICPSEDDLPPGIEPYSYLHWIFNISGIVDTDENPPELHLGGSGSGVYDFEKNTGVAFHFFTPYFDLDTLTAYADFVVTEIGGGKWVLTISHGCAGPEDYEELTVSKTVVTSYIRTHDWSIEKSVDPTELYLYIPGQGNDKPSTADVTWTIDVAYEDYVDSDWNVSGVITIKNTGTLAAVITDIDDVLAGTLISIDCGSFVLGNTLAVGSTLTCTYDEDGFIEGSNVVTVTTEQATYSATKAIVWGDPTTEVNKTVAVKDISDLFGEVELDTVTAPDGATFTYDETFDWEDYGDAACGDHTYDNTAQIIGDGDVVLDEASATLNVYVQCYVDETAYAKGDPSTCFIPTFSNWGWTNPISSNGTYTWDLWAAAGQCDTSKGTLVGSVTVVYSAGNVAVYYDVDSPYLLQDTHVYAGTTEYPMVKVGKKLVATVAPGQYYITNPLYGSIYVIAHAVVGLPDPSFGP
jgi:hypothetical protein